MRAVSRSWWVLSFVLASAACTGGGGSTGAAPGPSSGPSGNPTPSGGDDDDGHCTLVTTLSGGLAASFRGGSAACVYTSQSVSLTELGGGGIVVNLTFTTLEAGKTGSFPATIEVSQRVGQTTDRWLGAQCTIDVSSNEKLPDDGRDGGPIAFANWLIVGSGSCRTDATQSASATGAGAKAPVTIAPFTFSLLTLFY